MRVCVVYDCLYPYSIGGAERWYRNLAERLASAGHEVDFLTLRQWPEGEDAVVAGVRVHAVGPRQELYARGRRKLGPPLRFGFGVFKHLLRHGRRYEVVHTASFPYFSVLAAGLLRRAGGYRIVVDWHEVWSKRYWLDYAGRGAGLVGWYVQALCARVPQRAFCFSRLHAERLRGLGLRGEVSVLEGEYAGSLQAPELREADPLLVFAGRHIPEKRPVALVDAFSLLREQLPGLRCELYGDGPERRTVLERIGRLGLDGSVSAPGVVDGSIVTDAFRRAMCHVLPSRREGYGLVVVEAAAAGTPSVVVKDPDNAATELVEDGVNGAIADSAEPEALAAAILRVHQGGLELRRSTVDWFARNAQTLSIESSLTAVVEAYRAP